MRTLRRKAELGYLAIISLSTMVWNFIDRAYLSASLSKEEVKDVLEMSRGDERSLLTLRPVLLALGPVT